MEKNLITSNHDNLQSSIFIYSSTVHEHSIDIQYNILANTSTLAGSYTIIHIAEPTPLPSLTFEDIPTYYDPIVCNEQIHHVQHDLTSISDTSLSILSKDNGIITNIDFIYSIHDISA